MRTLNETHPRPVAGLVGHRGGITYIDSKVLYTSFVQLFHM